MLAEYEIDTKLLGYWILGLTIVLTVLGLYLADFSFTQVFENEPALEITVEDEVLEPNELTTLTVTENGEPVQGAEIRADSLNIGETKRNGKLTFRALENDFSLNATYNSESATEEITVLTEEEQEELNEIKQIKVFIDNRLAEYHNQRDDILAFSTYKEVKDYVDSLYPNETI